MSNKESYTPTHTTVEYITPNKTIETISFENSDNRLYIYNYKGCHYRVFTSLLSLIRFFAYGDEPKHCFDTDEEVDDFIERYKFAE